MKRLLIEIFREGTIYMIFNRLLIILSLLLSLLGPVNAQNITLADIREVLESDIIEGLYHRTYRSLLDRIDSDGFLQESLTGRYPGMFPRTVGGAVSLFLETGELEVAEKLISCTLQAMTLNEMERIPHVFLRQKNNLLPVFNGQADLQKSTAQVLYDLKEGEAAALKFQAPQKPICAVESAVKLGSCKGILTLTIREELESKPLLSVSINTKDAIPGQIWHRFAVSENIKLSAGREYYLRFDFKGSGYPKWYGRKVNPDQMGRSYRLNTETAPPLWIYEPGYEPAYALDCGALRHEQQTEPYNIYCDWDQIDGQAHVIMAWARLALHRGHTNFETRTYPLLATLMDRTSDQPYFMWGRGHEVSVNLIQNISFEHSREGRYWHVWDLLTQCVVGASLEAMTDIAKRQGDAKRSLRWRDRLQVLKKGIKKNLTRSVNGKEIYLEMRLPNSAGGVPYNGMSWVNFAPVMAQWNPLDRQTLNNTIEVMREKLVLPYKGHCYMAMEYDPDGNVNSRWIIGKGIGWEIDYARQEKEYDRIKEWLDFLKSFHSGDLYSESLFLNDNNVWETGDGGNGEQSTWWCWAMSRLRKEAGLEIIGSHN
jgi:hypothetical protein